MKTFTLGSYGEVTCWERRPVYGRLIYIYICDIKKFAFGDAFVFCYLYFVRWVTDWRGPTWPCFAWSTQRRKTTLRCCNNIPHSKHFHTVKENQFLTQLWSISPQLMTIRPCLDNLVVRVAEVIGSLSLILSSFENLLTDAIRCTRKTFSIAKVKQLSFKHLIRCQTLQTGSTLGQTLSCEHVNSTGQHLVNMITKLKKANGTVVLTYEPDQESSYEHIKPEQSRQQRPFHEIQKFSLRHGPLFDKWTI